jgi:hypothetical protein
MTPPRGFEPDSLSTISTNDLRQSTPDGAAKSGAVGAESTSTGNLESLAAALLALPPADRARLAALLAGQQTEQEQDEAHA